MGRSLVHLTRESLLQAVQTVGDTEAHREKCPLRGLKALVFPAGTAPLGSKPVLRKKKTKSTRKRKHFLFINPPLRGPGWVWGLWATHWPPGSGVRLR